MHGRVLDGRADDDVTVVGGLVPLRVTVVPFVPLFDDDADVRIAVLFAFVPVKEVPFVGPPGCPLADNVMVLEYEM